MSSTKTGIQLSRVFLQYPADGEAGPRGLRVNASDANRWVALDAAGYPYSVPINQAYDFRSLDGAAGYNNTFKNVFLVREVTITYEFKG